MSDLRDRIYPHHPLGDGKTGYIRADLYETLQAENARLREALEAAEAWIVDGGHVDDDDARNGATGARSVYQAIRAVIDGQQT